MRSRRYIWALFLATTMLALVSVQVLSRKQIPFVLKLSDGREIVVLDVTHGTNNTFVPGDMWDKLRYRVLPSKGIGFGKFRISPVSPAMQLVSDRNNIVLWLGQQESNRISALHDGSFQATLSDEKGTEWEVFASPYSHPGLYVRDVDGISAFIFDNYPRRARTFRCRIYADSEWQEKAKGWFTLVDFKLPNPTPGPYPVWKPTPLPTIQTNGDLEVSLIGLTTGSQAIKSQRYPNGKRVFTKISFEVKKKGRVTDDWLVDQMEATDATGNHLTLPISQYELHHNLLTFDSLDPGEVWKLRVRLSKKQDASSERLWTSPELAFKNESSDFKAVNLSMNWQNGCITLRPLHDSIIPDFCLNEDSLPKNVELRLTGIVDNQGRAIEHTAITSRDAGLSMQLNIASGTKWIKISVRLVEIRFYEFVVQPAHQ